MDNKQAQQTDKRTATQRLEDAEKALMTIFPALNHVAKEMETIKEALKLLGNKADAMAKLSVSGHPLNDENIGKAMVQNNVETLASKVKELVTQGLLAPADVVNDTSFIVGQEVDDQGVVQNPRLQFSFKALQPEFQLKLSGAKVGDVVTLKEGSLKYGVLEIYNIQPQQTEELQTAPSADTSGPVMDSSETAPVTPTTTVQ